MENSALSDRIRLPFSFDVPAMQQDLNLIEALSLDWIDHFVQQNYEGSWSVIPLRANAGAVHPIKMIYSDPTSDEYVDTPFLAPSQTFKSVLGTFQAPLLSARLMKLGKGSKIKEHRDYDLNPDGGTVRIHVPVITNPAVDFRLNGQRVIMQEGECWYLRLSDPHSVSNAGPDRIHLVIDMKANDWVLDLLRGH
ncbi:aspartyl/asparaginyl beta-hydroxylase domain-containing protein [Neolewinella agarilytica]|uniref:Aspartyl/Asparaginyl beta-hydroxylase n=1 Tax=Neolewinella agarilytica TaxID=478744 RepID=A0A1H9DR77_9BACT|nr:aspartyl/asparaginyl beta-hydroxylase domain-containing protein [Neolewinella agarilytica]SEQ16030.1 Aspartyl/Asparaginyl beta-hydroxylase [Neolewinella agarilytica]